MGTMAEQAHTPIEAMEPVDFLRAVMRGLHSLCSQGPGWSFQAVGFHEDPAELYAQAQAEVERGRHVWFGVNPITEAPAKGRGTGEDILSVSTLVADLDWRSGAHADEDLLPEREVRGIFDDFTPAPTIIVETGHGLQAYWLLSPTVSVAIGEKLTIRLHTALAAAGLKPERKDMASVLRVPGTLNLKLGEERPVWVAQANLHRRYTRGQLDVILPANVAAVAPEARQERRERVAGLPVQHDRPGDRWAESVSWRQVLEGDGWTYVRTADGVDYWTRPGKDARDGISATVGYKGSNVLKMFSGSHPHLRQDETYTKFGYLAAVKFGNDQGAAARWCKEWLDGPVAVSAGQPIEVIPAPTPEEVAEVRSFIDRLRAETYRGIAGLAAIPPVTWRVRNVIQVDGLFQFFAPSSAGKSFAAVDLACCVATGKKWHGLEVVQGPVVYVVAEGAAGIRDRMMAWARYHNDGADPTDVYVITLPAMLHRWDEVGALGQWCAELGAVMVIIDTYARSTLGLDENDNSSAGLAVDGLDSLRRATGGASIGVIHHTGHSGGRGRGASALYGAMETVVAMEGDTTSVSMTTRYDKGGKQKNGNDDWGITLAKVVQAVGRLDEYGTPVTTLVLAHDRRIESAEEVEGACGETLSALVSAATDAGLTKAEWMAVAAEKGVSRATFYRHLKRLSETDCLTEVVRQHKTFYLPKRDLSHAVSSVSHPPSQSSLTVSAALCAETGETRETRQPERDPSDPLFEDF